MMRNTSYGVLLNYDRGFGNMAAFGGSVSKSPTRQDPVSRISVQCRWDHSQFVRGAFPEGPLSHGGWSLGVSLDECWFFGPTLELAFNQAKIYHWRLMRLHRAHPNAENPFGEEA